PVSSCETEPCTCRTARSTVEPDRSMRATKRNCSRVHPRSVGSRAVPKKQSFRIRAAIAGVSTTRIDVTTRRSSFVWQGSERLRILQVENFDALRVLEHPFAEIGKVGDIERAILPAHQVDELLIERIA